MESEEILLKHASSKTQVLEVDAEGYLIKSTDALMEVYPGQHMAELHPFFESIQSVLEDKDTQFPLRFSSVNDIFPSVSFADITVYSSGDRYYFIIENQTQEYRIVQDIQQERNTQNIEANLKEQQRKSLELETELLRLRNEELVKMQNFKSRFFASVSHELRTPINGIIGVADLIEKSESPEERGKYIKSLKSSANHLHAIVNDILDLNKMESGRFELHNESVSLRSFLDDVTLSFYYQAQEKGLKMLTEFSNQLPRRVMVDPTRLRQILFNLLSNALKFTKEGEIKLTVKVEEQKGNHYNLLFEVRDTGIGISREKYEKIFEEYSQASKEINQKYGGTGLGLSVAQKLVDLYSGKIDVHSKVGEGSTFFFNLWVERVEEEESRKNSYKELSTSNITILLVEDDPVSLMVLKGIFKDADADIITSLNSQEARDLIHERNIDLIITDRQMPDIKGDALAEDLKKHNPEGKVILLSGESLENDDPLLTEGTVDKALLKPVNPSQLYSAVDELFS